MSKAEKALADILCGDRDNNIQFDDLRAVLERLSFSCRVKGGHFIFFKDGVAEIINLQPVGSKAKPYQVRQVRNLILDYKMGGSIRE